MAMRDAARGGAAGHSAGTSAIRRIQKELQEMSKSPSRYWTASPVADDLFEWQFAVRGPPATDFEGGIYTGRIVLPANYPLAPPSITLLTPNGRWEVGKKICLSNSSYHPELWQPAWGIRTIMEALRTQFPLPGEGAIGALDWPSDLRKRLAKESLDWVGQPANKPNRELLPELTAEELKEESPEPPPLSEMPVPEPVAVNGGEAAGEGDAPPGGAVPSAPDAPPGAQSIDDSEPHASQGLRQRHAAGDGARVSSASATQPSNQSLHEGVPAQASRNDVSGAHASSGGISASSDAAPAGPGGDAGRRRREGARQQRRQQQSVIMQVLKPPRSGRGWVMLLINLLILMLTLSFLFLLADLACNPPKLLDAMPDPKEQPKE